MSDAKTRDANGAELADGDNVTLIKDLKVKGAGGVTLKRAWRRADDPSAGRLEVLSSRPQDLATSGPVGGV